MIQGANHTGFTVSNVEESIAFYRDLLGLKLLSLAERDPGFSEKISGIPGARMKTAYLQTPDGHQLELIQYLSPPGTKLDNRTNNVGSGHLAMNVSDLRALYATLRSKGVQFKSPPLEVPAGPNRGNLAVYCVDPDGITVELLQIRRRE